MVQIQADTLSSTAVNVPSSQTKLFEQTGEYEISTDIDYLSNHSAISI